MNSAGWEILQEDGFDASDFAGEAEEAPACPHCNDTGAVVSALGPEGLEDCPRCSAG